MATDSETSLSGFGFESLTDDLRTDFDKIISTMDVSNIDFEATAAAAKAISDDDLPDLMRDGTLIRLMNIQSIIMRMNLAAGIAMAHKTLGVDIDWVCDFAKRLITEQGDRTELIRQSLRETSAVFANHLNQQGPKMTQIRQGYLDILAGDCDAEVRKNTQLHLELINMSWQSKGWW